MRDLGTRDCPVAGECDSCSSSEELRVWEADTQIGVICMTLCERCADREEMPRLGWGDAARMVLEHCEHRGIDLDEAARLREVEEESWR
jgi:hypothetical protein